MKIVFIILLSTQGLLYVHEPIPDGKKCLEVAEEWRNNNTTHTWEVNGDATLNGYYVIEGHPLQGSRLIATACGTTIDAPQD